MQPPLTSEPNTESVNCFALSFYIPAALADAVALYLALRQLPGRILAWKEPLPPEPQIPLTYNAHLSVVESMLAAQTAAMVDASIRSGFNELIEAVRAEAHVRKQAARASKRCLWRPIQAATCSGQLSC